MPIIDRVDPRLKYTPDWAADVNRSEIDRTDEVLKQIAGRICAFVPSDEPFTSSVPPLKIDQKVCCTLEECLRFDIGKDIENKKGVLLDHFGGVSPNAEASKELQKIIWPDPGRVNLERIRRFLDQPRFSSGTGFSIGDGLVVTAGHVIEDWTHKDLESWRLVFGAYGDRYQLQAKTFSAGDVLCVRRIIHRIVPTWNLDLLDPTKNIWTMANILSDANTYDFAILECSPLKGQPMIGRDPFHLQVNTGAVSMPEALTLDPDPVLLHPGRQGTQVSTIGCSNGISFKHTKNGEVKRVPNPNYKGGLDEQGTLAAAIDTFEGNSGGPLFRDDVGTVIGVTRASPPFTYMHKVLDAATQKSGMAVEARDVQPPRLLHEEVQSWIRARGATDNLYKTFLVDYGELRTIPAVNRQGQEIDAFSWQRFKDTDPPIVVGNTFTRTDPFAHFTNRLSEFTVKRSGRISVSVTVASAKYVIDSQDELIFSIWTPQKQFQGPHLKGKWSSSNSPQWQFEADSTTRPVPEYLKWDHGLCSWDKITLEVVANDDNPNPFVPGLGSVTVTFCLPDKQGKYQDAFKFKIENLDFDIKRWKVGGGYHKEWQAPLGMSIQDPNAPCWTGPYDPNPPKKASEQQVTRQHPPPKPSIRPKKITKETN